MFIARRPQKSQQNNECIMAYHRPDGPWTPRVSPGPVRGKTGHVLSMPTLWRSWRFTRFIIAANRCRVLLKKL